MVGDAPSPAPARCADGACRPVHAGTHDVHLGGAAHVGKVAIAQIADAVVDGERYARNHLVGSMSCLDFKQEALQLGLLVHQADDEREVGH